jgi:hypothetical protein
MARLAPGCGPDMASIDTDLVAFLQTGSVFRSCAARRCLEYCNSSHSPSKVVTCCGEVTFRNVSDALCGTNRGMFEHDSLAAEQHMAAAAMPVGVAACRTVCATWVGCNCLVCAVLLAAALGVCSFGTLVGS